MKTQSLHWNRAYWNMAQSTIFDSLWPGDTIWWYRRGSTLAQVMACCLMAPSYYLNQRWLIINRVLWNAPESNCIRHANESDSKPRNTLGCLDQYRNKVWRLWNSQDHKTVQVYKYRQRMETMKQSRLWSSVGAHGSLVVIWWLFISSSGETRKFDFLGQIWPWRSRSIAPQNNRVLYQGILHLWSKFGGPSMNGWWVIARTSYKGHVFKMMKSQWRSFCC